MADQITFTFNRKSPAAPKASVIGSLMLAGLAFLIQLVYCSFGDLIMPLKVRAKIAIITACLWAGTTSFAQKALLSASPKDIFNNRSSLALRCSVLKLNQNGEYLQILANTIFGSGDEIRLSVTSNERGFLYIVHQGSTGAWILLYPQSDVVGTSNLVEAGEPHVIPGGGPNDDPQDDFKFDNHPGEERIFILLARKPVPDLDRVIDLARRPKEKAKVKDSVIANLRQQSKDLVQVEDEQKVVFAAPKTPSPGDDVRIVLDLKLSHQ